MRAMRMFRIPLILCLIAVLVVSVYLPSTRNGFVNWDDNEYVVQNRAITSLSWSSVRELVSSFHMGYTPLTMLAYAVEYNFFGLDAQGYHLTGLALHVLNCWLVFFVLLLLTGSPGTAALAAALWGVHPLQSETVAWISETKGLLCAVFFFSALLAYIRYVRSGCSRLMYAAVLFLYVLSVLAKPVSITLPFALICLDIFIFKRRIKGALLEKIPFFAIALAAAALGAAAQFSIGAVRPEGIAATAERLMTVWYCVVFYVGKLVMPVRLACIYPFPVFDTPAKLFLVLSLLTAVSLMIAGVISRKVPAKALSACALFLACSLPILQIVPVSGEMTADRYMYIPSVWFFYLAAVAAAAVFRKLRSPAFRVPAAAAGCAVLLAFSLSSRAQSAVWKDSLSLWDDVLRKYPNGLAAVAAYTKRGEFLLVGKRFPEAISDLERAVELGERMPHIAGGLVQFSYHLVYAGVNLANAYEAYGRTDMAEAVLKRLMAEYPMLAEFPYRLGLLYERRKDHAAAVAMQEKAIGIQPLFLPAYTPLADAYRSAGDPEKLAALYRSAVSRNIEFYEAYQYMGGIYQQDGRFSEAVRCYRRVLKWSPEYAPAWAGLGTVYVLLGKTERAERFLLRAVDLEPGLPEAHVALAALYAVEKRCGLAKEHAEVADALGAPMPPELTEKIRDCGK